ncbi:cytosolic sulfotransferase 3-like [Clavelina lepadiformis]|uniref:cytosolic sulfotransferase 3-like n=1 Tax=Clavelina lepadiformis TaxID=159417 RepID=UPI0040438C2B
MEWQYDNWNPTNDDVLVASYPKTGTTWMTAIVKNIIYRDSAEKLEMTKSISFLYSYLEQGIPLKYEVMEKLPWKRKIWGTHLPAPLVNMEKLKKNGCKIIYMVRNPKDQAVSWFHFCQKDPFIKSMEGYSENWDEFFNGYISGKQANCAKEGEWYPDHILSWYPYRNDDNVMFMAYEDLKKNTAVEVKKLCDFLNVKRSHDEILSIVKETSFDQMQTEAYGLNKSYFFRKGRVGEWKRRFTVLQSEQMDEKIEEKFSGTDIKFTYV